MITYACGNATRNPRLEFVELLLDRSEDATLDLEIDLALVFLRIDDHDPIGTEDDVIDVCPTARNASVVQDAEPRASHPIEHPAEEFFAARTDLPSLRRLPLLEHLQQQAARAWESLAYPSVSLRHATLILLTSRAASGAIDVVRPLRSGA